MQTLVIVVHVIVGLAIIALVLLQRGKGADAGASFGGGASQTVFGASGSGNFLTRATTIAAALFFVTSLALAIFARENAGIAGVSGSPLVNPEILEEVQSTVSDLPQVDDTIVPADIDGDIPAVPLDNGAN